MPGSSAPPGQRSRTDEVLSSEIRFSFIASDRTYDVKRVWHNLLAKGVDWKLHRIERLRREHGL